MRRKEKEITNRDEIDSILNNALVCRLGLCEENRPYIVPVCFGYDGDSLFFHSALEGKKIDILKQNFNVSFEVESDISLQRAEKPCSWGMEYKSVIGSGKAIFLSTTEEKEYGLNVIMRHYAKKDFSFPPEALKRVCVIKIDIETLTGKKSC